MSPPFKGTTLPHNYVREVLLESFPPSRRVRASRCLFVGLSGGTRFGLNSSDKLLEPLGFRGAVPVCVCICFSFLSVVNEALFSRSVT